MSLTLQEEEELVMLTNWDTWSQDPWKWVKDCCYTMDEADEGKTKKFPDKEYLAYICTVWMQQNILAIPKTRRMMLSWIMLALHLWAALFHPQLAVFIQSKKEKDSAFLMSDERLMFIYNHLPIEYNWPKIIKKNGGPDGVGYSYIKFSNSTYIMAVGQGADQMRGYTASYVMLDEMAFWEQAEASWGSLKPTIQGGGKVALISSAGPGFFQRICEGEI
jgi:phage FluMu gp28-like protein